jgi:hypothetical protein
LLTIKTQKQMKTVKLTAVSTMVAQVAAGESFDAVIDDNGTVYLPFMQGDFGAARAAANTGGGEAAASTSRGRGAAKPAADAGPKVSEAEVTKIFTQLNDDGETNAALAALTALNPAAEAAVTKVVENFMTDSTTPLETAVADALAALTGGAAAAPAKTGRGAAKAAPAEKLLEIADLKKGMKVDVYLNESNFDEAEQAGWYPGEVTAVGRGGKVTFTFDDGDVLEYNAETMDKVREQK